MTSIRGAAIALMLCGPFAATPVLGVGETSQQSSLYGWMQQRAPLAHSADGQWRFHMDTGQVLHRTSNGADGRVQSIKLPVNAMALASSRSGERVAFLSQSVCVGVASFRDAGEPTIEWVPSTAPAPHYNGSQQMAPGMRPELECGGPAINAIDISSDGRLRATPFHVIDIESGKVIAQLPKSTGEGYESPTMPSKLQIAVWDMDAGTLRRLDTIDSG